MKYIAEDVQAKISKKAIFIFLILWYDTNECAAAWDLGRPGGERRVTDMKRHWSAGLFWLAVLVLTLSGCFFPGAGGPVSESGAVGGLPEPDPDHPKREECPVQEYGVEVEDISVMSGNNTALIQLQDMDGKRFLGDGGHLFPGPDADRPLKIYFFTKSDEDTYTASAVVEGTGSSIYRVDYVDLNGNGPRKWWSAGR